LKKRRPRNKETKKDVLGVCEREERFLETKKQRKQRNQERCFWKNVSWRAFQEEGTRNKTRNQRKIFLGVSLRGVFKGGQMTVVILSNPFPSRILFPLGLDE
jgi:hypothetical protein